MKKETDLLVWCFPAVSKHCLHAGWSVFLPRVIVDSRLGLKQSPLNNTKGGSGEAADSDFICKRRRTEAGSWTYTGCCRATCNGRYAGSLSACCLNCRLLICASETRTVKQVDTATVSCKLVRIWRTLVTRVSYLVVWLLRCSWYVASLAKALQFCKLTTGKQL